MISTCLIACTQTSTWSIFSQLLEFNSSGVPVKIDVKCFVSWPRLFKRLIALSSGYLLGKPIDLSYGKQRFLPIEHLGPGFIKPSCHRNLFVLALFAGKCGWFSRDWRGFGVDQSKLSIFQISPENSWLTCNLKKTPTSRMPQTDTCEIIKFHVP